MPERVVRFGDPASLTGIVTEPVQAEAGDAPGLLLLNAGVLHRVGPARLHVALARGFAAAGYPALRFDFSGIGDSEARRDPLPFDTSSVLEVRAAMDWLGRSMGVQRFVLFGLCSGADVALQAALADERVVGCATIDGVAYRTPGYYVHYYAPRLLRARSWYAFAKRQAMRGLRPLRRLAAGNASAQRRPAISVRAFPPRAQTTAALGALARRGVHQFFIYSAGHERWYNHPGQFDSMFRGVDFQGRACVRYFDSADHTFPDVRQQAALVAAIRDWAREIWPVPMRLHRAGVGAA